MAELETQPCQAIAAAALVTIAATSWTIAIQQSPINNTDRDC